jgi:hypothetical protein
MQASDTTMKAPGSARNPMNKIRLYMTILLVFTGLQLNGKGHPRHQA